MRYFIFYYTIHSPVIAMLTGFCTIQSNSFPSMRNLFEKIDSKLMDEGTYLGGHKICITGFDELNQDDFNSWMKE